jgi:glucosamine--fructose-6-phosphate aminotransferase (isomerizing)
MAGELKHGPLALVDGAMPMIMIITRDPTYQVRCFCNPKFYLTTPYDTEFHFRLQVVTLINRFFFQKCMNALQQVVAREGRPILIGEEGDEETKEYASKFIGVPHAVDCLQGNLSFQIALQIRECNVYF